MTTMEPLRGYSRLLIEIKNRGVRKKDIASYLGINRQALAFKLSGRRNARFTVEQAIQIKERFFPDMSVEELFKK